jgi:hypothetical protein
LKFQGKISSYKINKIQDIVKLKKEKYQVIIKLFAETVSEVSSYKNSNSPMLGSKIMHFLFPELFPVYDNEYVKKYLHKEPEPSEDWLPKELKNSGNNEAMKDYIRYLTLMFQNIYETSSKELKTLRKKCIQYSGIDKKVINYHLFDITTLLFEICLIGKYL